MMSSSRHHIAILFDPCTLSAMKESVSLKKSNYELQFERTFLSMILEPIAEYMRIIFDLHPSFITFDVISCGDRIHSQTSITKSGYLGTIDRFSSIIGVEECEQTKFVEAMERFLLELPSDFYNSHNFDSPFDSHQFPPQTHILFIARNQAQIEKYKFCINRDKMTTINFADLCKTAKLKNDSIGRVHILKYDQLESPNSEWTRTTKAAYKQKKKEKMNELEDGELIEDDQDEQMYDGAEFIDFYEATASIDSLHSFLVTLICQIQFPAMLRRMPIVSVPFKDPLTQKKTALTIPMILCLNSHMAQNENVCSLEWKKVDEFDWSHFLISDIALIAPSKLNDTSRLLMKFVTKKKIATLSANYAHSKNEKITHCIMLIGMKIYLVSLVRNVKTSQQKQKIAIKH